MARMLLIEDNQDSLELMSRPFGLVVSDLQLRGMGWGGARARELGVEHFLARPIEPQRLLDVVAECLFERKERHLGQNPGR